MSQNNYDSFSRNFWDNLEKLQEFDKCTYNLDDTVPISREEVLSRLEDIVVQVVHQISGESIPNIRLRNRRTWENCRYVPNYGIQMVTTPTFSTVSFAKENSVEKFGLILKIMSMIYKLLQSDQVATKRDLYYEEPHLFRNQTMLDHIIDDIACMLEVPRRFLNVVATSKGCVVGDLSYTGPDGEVVDCLSASSGVMIPSRIDKLDNFSTVHAKFVLVVEKDATFQRLIDDGLITSMPCVMITGKGVPDVNTRLMVKRIWKELEIPVFGLMDADPHGIEIMFVYRFGSVSQSFDATSLSLPFLKWIGIFSSDIRRLQLPDDAVKALTSNDEMKCRDMLSRPYIPFHHDIQQEIHEMLLTKKKAEIQSLTRISQKYLSQVFIPSKIKHGDWI